MYKLLVNTPQETQEIIEVGEGGGYFDTSLVLWDERQDGALPAITVGGMKRVGDTLVLDSNLLAVATAKELLFLKTTFIASVKTEAGSLTQKVLQGLGSEYELAEKESTAYKSAGYPATIPGSVQSEINSKAAKGLIVSATVACETILIAATGWRNAQAALRDKRLTTVSAADVAVDAAGLDVIKAKWTDFIVSLRTELGV
jgi:hypothetical protein